MFETLVAWYFALVLPTGVPYQMGPFPRSLSVRRSGCRYTGHISKVQQQIAGMVPL